MSDVSVQVEKVPGGRRIQLFGEQGNLRQGEYIARLGADPAFADWYSDQLTQIGGAAFFWEHPPMSLATVDAPAEFVLLDAPSLEAVPAEPGPFAEHFVPGDAGVCVFSSLGGSSQLIAPNPLTGASAYSHLAVFLQTAPVAQRRALWSATASEVQRAMADRTVWLSTSGLGVFWLHVRIDQRPKYYQWQAYAQAGNSA